MLRLQAIELHQSENILQSNIPMVEERRRTRRRKLLQFKGSLTSLLREPQDRNMLPVLTSAASCNDISLVDLPDTH